MAKLNKKQTEERDSLRANMLYQLEKMGADVEVFVDLVDKYIDFWEIDQMLTADIRERGTMYTDVSSVGVPMMKNNPSVKEKVMVNRQMLAILQQLKITTEGQADTCADDL